MTKVFVLLIGSLALTAAHVLYDDEDYLRVATYKGDVKGSLHFSCRSGRPFVAFRGIPYAKPPVGPLRFKDPVNLKRWDGLWNGTYQRPPCMQLKNGVPLEGASEDCLYLNIFSPNIPYLEYGVASDTFLKPVMVFIHPGAFTYGDSNEKLFSPDFFMDQDVLLVTFNYRLGALGFLSLQNRDVPGNAGLKDQNLALWFVKENIKWFGGDPSKITIFGQSAGSASVNYHLLSEKSKHLFHYAIMESGVALSPWAFTPPENALKKGMNLAKRVGCQGRTKAETLKCLQSIPVEWIEMQQDKTISIQEFLTMGVIPFQPTIEPDYSEAFLTKHPQDLMASGNFTQVPTIIGMTNDEGLFALPEILKIDPYGVLMAALGLDLSRFVPQEYHVRPFSKEALYAHAEISRFYFSLLPVSKFTMTKLGDLITDVMFTLPVQKTATLLSKFGTPVYNYLFTYDGGYNIMKYLERMYIRGVFHGDELGYLFYVPMLHTRCTPNRKFTADEKMIDWMTTLWANFAKTGDPNIVKGTPNTNKWKRYTDLEQDYLDIGYQVVPSKSPKRAKITFWRNLLSILEKMGKSKPNNPYMNFM